jgi:hypothetical protein
MSVYRLAKISNLPYATVREICCGKTQIEKCSAETIYRLSKALGISMEELIEPYMYTRSSFENFKSNVCHQVKESGDMDFIMNVLDSEIIFTYYKRNWYPGSLYLLAMLDYISRENGIPLCDDYDDIRRCKLERLVYPLSLLAMSAAAGNDTVLQMASVKAIPEFMRFNILESDVRNVI